MTEPQSPLHGVAEFVSPGGAVRLCELQLRGHLQLRGEPGDAKFLSRMESALGYALPLAPNSVSGDALWLGPDEWWILTATDKRAEILQSLEQAVAGMFAALNDQSAGHTVIRISGDGDGEHARDVLRSGCTVDLHPKHFAHGQCAQTVIAKTNVTLLPAEDERNQWRCDLITRRSFAAHLWHWLADAAVGVDGRERPAV